MKRELSFYEFVALIIPSVILLFSINFILTLEGNKPFFDFSNIGESVIFLCFSYALGHIIQGIGNFLESFIWFCFGGMPTKWLLKVNRFNKNILDQLVTEKIKAKLCTEFGDTNDKMDYGTLIYNKLYCKQLTGRIDIFNGNYSLFRGLSVTFIILTSFMIFKYNYQLALICGFCLFISIRRMIRFAQTYAKEIYKTYLTQF